MSKSVIWATDGSAHADHALEVARSLGLCDDAVLTVVHSEEYLVGPGAKGAVPLNADEDSIEARIARQTHELAGEGLTATLRVVRPGAVGTARRIADVAAEIGADTILAGTRGRSPVVGLLVGSVTQKLLDVAPCAVLAVPAPA
jgi:nucleotide-binding universal stress UspA family protein